MACEILLLKVTVEGKVPFLFITQGVLSCGQGLSMLLHIVNEKLTRGALQSNTGLQGAENTH